MSTVFDAILARRSASAKFLVAPGPDEAVVARILHAGSRAPDHGRLVPFRFIRIAEASRPRFADVLGAAAAQDMPGISEPELEKAREKAFQGPCLIGLIARIDPTIVKIPPSDQWLTVGCALENMLLAVAEAGYAAAVRSGGYLATPAVRQAFGLAETEHFTCFLAIGTATEWPPAKLKPDPAAITSVW